MQCLCSVIIPTRNRAGLLRECLDSVAAQTYRPLEIIVVDDGSTDDTDSVVASFRKQIRLQSGLDLVYLRLSHGGAPKARNTGVACATGEFIQYVDSDDLLHPRKVELHMAAFAAHPNVEFVWGAYSHFDGSPPAKVEYQTESVLRETYCFHTQRWWQDLPGMVHIGMFRRQACSRIGPWCETLVRWQDVDYMTRFARLQPRIARHSAALYYLRQHTGGRISDFYKNREGVPAGLHSLSIIERGFPAIPSPDNGLQRELSNLYRSIAETALEYGLLPEFRTALNGAMRHRREAAFRARVLVIRLVCACAGVDCGLKLLRSYHPLHLFATFRAS
jgi:glycosyltransferase involved in cell wall biosynthesis